VAVVVGLTVVGATVVGTTVVGTTVVGTTVVGTTVVGTTVVGTTVVGTTVVGTTVVGTTVVGTIVVGTTVVTTAVLEYSDSLKGAPQSSVWSATQACEQSVRGAVTLGTSNEFPHPMKTESQRSYSETSQRGADSQHS
jgi:hypothetical protein